MINKEILKTVKRIEISTKGIINSVMAGAYHSTFKGNGMEFTEVREYVVGDDIRSIDWNVTARTGDLHVKKFAEERELTVMLAVDASASASFGSKEEMKGEVMATISALLAFSAIKNNDKVGLLIFTTEVELFIPPQKGRKHVLRLIRELLYFKPQQRGTKMSAAFEHLVKMMRRRAVVMVVSDFQDEDFEKSLRLLKQRHDVLAVNVGDVREVVLPSAGFLELEDAETGETVLVDSGDRAFREAFNKKATKEQNKLEKIFKKMSVDYVRVEIEDNYKDTLKPLINFFIRRSKENGKRA
jgi:uncharacterized protein (DUF58 family)